MYSMRTSVATARAVGSARRSTRPVLRSRLRSVAAARRAARARVSVHRGIAANLRRSSRTSVAGGSGASVRSAASTASAAATTAAGSTSSPVKVTENGIGASNTATWTVGGTVGAGSSVARHAASRRRRHAGLDDERRLRQRAELDVEDDAVGGVEVVGVELLGVLDRR